MMEKPAIEYMTEKEFDDYYDKLQDVAKPLLKYYDIDKVKAYGIYVWTKTGTVPEEDECNLFDIYYNEIVYYKNHNIIEEAMPIIKNIQEQLKVLKSYDRDNTLG